MSGLNLAKAQQKLNEYLAAETAVLTSQSYTMSGRSLTRANLNDIREGITYWNAKVNRLSRGGISIRGIDPVYVRGRADE